jgi:large subunit ribosomal protein L19
MNLIQTLEKEQAAKLSANKTIPDFEPGDTLIVVPEATKPAP